MNGVPANGSLRHSAMASADTETAGMAIPNALDAAADVTVKNGYRKSSSSARASLRSALSNPSVKRS
jgi:hypothetical protein